MKIEIILTVIAALGGLSGIAAFIKARSAARKDNINGLDTIIDNLREEIASLHGKYERLDVAGKDNVIALDVIIRNLREEVALLRVKCEKLTREYEALDAQYRQLERQYMNVLIWAKERGYCPPNGG